MAASLVKFHTKLCNKISSKDLMGLSSLIRPTRADINLDHLENNLNGFYNHLKKSTEKAQLLPVVKANGYGHGAIQLTIQALKLKNIVAGVSVATLEEAILLRKQLDDLNISCPLLLLLGALPKGAESIVGEFQITPTICTEESLKRFIQASNEMNKKQKFHLKLDTGMNRVGFSEKELQNALPTLKNAVESNLIEIDGIYTHLSKADEIDKNYTINQINSLQNSVELVKENGMPVRFIHSMNSAGSIDSNVLPFVKELNLFRIGISLYGLYPSNDVYKQNVPLQSLMRWRSEIVQLKNLEPGCLIGYGGTFKTTRQTKVAVLPVGYADGYRRLLSGTNEMSPYYVGIRGKKCNILGRVCMDMIMVDVTDVEDVSEGDEALLMGEYDDSNNSDLKLHCDDMAQRLKTINYEITCLVGERVPRFYYKNNKLVSVSSLFGTSFSEDWL